METDWPRNLHTLYTPRQVRMVLQRERLRADRNGRPMSAVVFDLPQGTRRQLQRLARTLLARARATDEVGWMSKRQLCAVLPETSPAGAERFAAGVRERAAGRGLSAGFVVYRYPEEGADDAGRPGGGVPLAVPAEAPRRRERQTAGGVAFAVERRVTHAVVGGGVVREPRGKSLPLRMLLDLRVPAWKRSMDVLGATVGLALFAPVMAVAAGLIRASSKGPVIFRQPRVGLGGRRFTILKFRTMVPDAEKMKAALRAKSEQDGPAFKMTHDPRVTWIGRFLRVTSLDELPQFWNVLVGNMSLVGPRPLPVDESNGCSPWHRRRLDAMPGLTCIWQVRGRSSVAFDDWIRMDLEYIRRQSILTDLKILALTVPAVVCRRGAH